MRNAAAKKALARSPVATMTWKVGKVWRDAVTNEMFFGSNNQEHVTWKKRIYKVIKEVCFFRLVLFWELYFFKRRGGLESKVA